MRILGIDPGTATVGYACVEGNKKSPQIVDYGVLRTKAQPKEFMPDRLLELAEDLEQILQRYTPAHAVVEDLFFFRNTTTVISVAQSRGMMLYLLRKYGVSVSSATPLQLKQTLCGYGRATKKQMQNMTQRVYHMESVPKPDDAADALALAWYGLK